MTAFCVGANATFANQLGTWLGEGDLALTRVYSANGPPIGGWGAFHTPQRGGGAFTVAQALVCNTRADCIVSNAVIGG